MNQPTAILLGLIVGILARGLFLRHTPGGLPLVLLLGVAGSMFSAFLAQLFGLSHRDIHMPQQILVCSSGALLLLAVFWWDVCHESHTTKAKKREDTTT